MSFLTNGTFNRPLLCAASTLTVWRGRSHVRTLRTGTLALMALIISGNSLVHAQGTIWSSAAMACVPSATTAAQALYVTTAGGVKFREGAVGSLTFICPVSAPLQDGLYKVAGLVNLQTDNDNGVTFLLRRAHKTSGAVSTVLEANSVRWNPGLNATFVYVETQASKAVNFDFDTYVYWVQFTNDRSDLSVKSVELRRYY
jgi:hypothetical protein